MNISVLKKLLPGLIPLLIFIVADEIWGTAVGLYVALITGLGELGYYYLKDRKIDRFILLDTGLLIVLGGVSIFLENDIFFKIKPALIELILLAVVAFSLWGPKNLIRAMGERYVGQMDLDLHQERMMRINMLVMFWITLIHIILVLYSAKYMSTGSWAFISGGLFYIMFGIYFAGLWLYNRYKTGRTATEEMFPVVNEKGEVTGTAPRRVCHDGRSMLLHPVVHLHLFDPDGRLFLQKRSANKDIQPGKWDTSVGGHVSPGENIDDALRREAREELGLKEIRPEFLHRYVWESARERELVFSFLCVSGATPVLNPDEIEDGRYWPVKEITESLGKEIFTSNFEHEFGMLKELFLKQSR